jgi:hypothetical protein
MNRLRRVTVRSLIRNFVQLIALASTGKPAFQRALTCDIHPSPAA